MARCRECEVLIVFVRMDTGSLMPTCPGPDSSGNIATRRAGSQLVGRVLTADRPLEEGEVPMLAHWAICRKSAPRKRDGNQKSKQAPAPSPTLF